MQHVLALRMGRSVLYHAAWQCIWTTHQVTISLIIESLSIHTTETDSPCYWNEQPGTWLCMIWDVMGILRSLTHSTTFYSIHVITLYHKLHANSDNKDKTRCVYIQQLLNWWKASIYIPNLHQWKSICIFYLHVPVAFKTLRDIRVRFPLAALNVLCALPFHFHSNFVSFIMHENICSCILLARCDILCYTTGTSVTLKALHCWFFVMLQMKRWQNNEHRGWCSKFIKHHLNVQ